MQGSEGRSRGGGGGGRGEERRGSVYVREGERGAVWFSLNPVDPARRDTAWTATCQRRRMQARHSEEILFLLQQHSMPPR